MSPGLLLAVALAASEAAPRLLVLPSEALGIAPALVDDIVLALRGEATARRLELVAADEERQLRPAATRCAGDLGCLAALGAQVRARWVITFGLGNTGDAIVIAGSRLDVEAARQEAFSSSRLARGELGALAIAETLAAELLPPSVAEPEPRAAAPPPAPAPQPAPAPAPTVAMAPGPLQARTYVAGGVAAALLAASAVLGAVAIDGFSRLPLADPGARPALEDRQRWVNGAADVCAGVGLGSAVVAVVFFFLDRSAESPEP